MIISGRDGQILYTPYATPGPGVEHEFIALKAWVGNFETEYEDISCFGNTNRVWLPGLKNIAGTLGGFWDSTETQLFDAASATNPGQLKLVPHEAEATFYWSGPAWLDASIDCSLVTPKVTGNFRAAGNWTGPSGHTVLLAA